MPTLTLRNVPQTLYDRLKERAARHRRTLNEEAIEILADSAERRTTAEIMAESDAFSAELRARGVWVTEEQLNAWINEGRD